MTWSAGSSKPGKAKISAARWKSWCAASLFSIAASLARLQTLSAKKNRFPPFIEMIPQYYEKDMTPDHTGERQLNYNSLNDC